MMKIIAYFLFPHISVIPKITKEQAELIVLLMKKKLVLCDLFIYNYPNPHNLIDWFFRLFEWKEPLHYRQRGLGTLLLNEALKVAQDKRINIIEGELAPQDLNETSYLANWYVKHGFTITGNNIKKRVSNQI